MKKLLRKLFDIREGEAPRALLMFAYIFLVICCLLMLKPVRNSLFLEIYSVKDIPYVFMLVAIFAAVVTSVYGRFAQKVRLDLLIKTTLLIILSNLLFFWLLLYFNYQGGWFLFVFYVWVAIFGVITTSQFWVLANYIFDAREAKRLFGFIGAGAISGGILGGYSTRISLWIGTENILLICAALLSFCLVILPRVWKRRAKEHQIEKIRQKQQLRHGAASANPFKLLKGSRHLVYLSVIVGIGVVVANLVDYQYIAIAKSIYPDKDELTAFFGFWLSTLSIISLVIQLFLTRRVLETFGVGLSLFFLPLGILIGAVSILLYPVLWAAILIKVSDGSFKQSINKAGLELLVLPIPSQIKPQAKAFIDVFVDSLATGIGGVLLILFTTAWGFAIGQISLVIIPLILAWIVFILAVRKEYINAFRLAIEKRTVDPEELFVNIQDLSLFESALKVLEGDNEKQIFYVLTLLENVKNERFISHFRNLLHHSSEDVRLHVLKIVAEYKTFDLSGDIAPLMEDQNWEVRAEALSYLFQKSFPQEKINLLQKFLHHPDYQTRAAALMSAARGSAESETIRKFFPMKRLIEDTLKSIKQMQGDEKKEQFIRRNIAQAIGEARNPELFSYLHILLNDSASEVLKCAVISAGKTGAREFVPVLIDLLNHKHARKFAREALANYGEDVIDDLAVSLNDPNQPRNTRLNIPKVMGMIGAQKTVDVLIANLDQTDLVVRFQVLRGLNRLRANFPMLKFNEKPIEKKLLEEVHSYMNTLTLLYARSQFEKNGKHPALSTNTERVKEAQTLLIRALEEKSGKNLGRIFRLLGLRYPAKDIYNAYLGIVSNKQDIRANAVEFLDNVLDSGLKKILIPLVETNSLEVLIEISRRQFQLEIPDEKASLQKLLQDNDDWLKICVLYLIAQMKDTTFLSVIGNLINSRDVVVKETALYALRQLEIGG
jgi:AAA family ATP:ADP antiporter